MTTVKEIPPRKKEPSIKKVAAYCRVSTKAQEQLDSLSTQESCYENKIKEALIKSTCADLRQKFLPTRKKIAGILTDFKIF